MTFVLGRIDFLNTSLTSSSKRFPGKMGSCRSELMWYPYFLDPTFPWLTALECSWSAQDDSSPSWSLDSGDEIHGRSVRIIGSRQISFFRNKKKGRLFFYEPFPFSFMTNHSHNVFLEGKQSTSILNLFVALRIYFWECPLVNLLLKYFKPSAKI